MSVIQDLQSFIAIIEPQCYVAELTTMDALIEEISYAVGDNSKAFANHLSTFLDLIKTHFNNINREEKRSLLENACTCIDLHVKIFKKHMNCIQKMINIILMIMVDVPEEVPQGFFNPPNGHKADDADEEDQIDPSGAVVLLFRNFVDRLASALGYALFIKNFGQKLIDEYNLQTDWRWKSSILMVISQLSEEVEVDKITPFIELAIKAASDTHPKVRYAAAQVIGQFADDMKPDFQNQYHSVLMPLMVQRLNDPIQRVAAHWIAALTNFVQDWSQPSILKPYLQTIFLQLQFQILNNNTICKQNAISCLASFGTILSIFDEETIKKIFEICFQIFTCFKDLKEYQQLRNQTVECVTILASSQPYPLIAQYMPKIVESLDYFANTLDSEYLLSAWSRLCLMKKRFSKFQSIYPKILNAVMTFYQSQADRGSDTGILPIQSTIECFQQQFYPFAADTLQKFKILLDSFIVEEDDETNQKAFSYIFDIITKILNKCKPANPDENWQKISTATIVYLFTKIGEIQKVKNVTILSSLYQDFKDVLTNYIYIMNSQEIEQLYSKFMTSQNELRNIRDQLCTEISMKTLSLNGKQKPNQDSQKNELEYENYGEQEGQDDGDNDLEVELLQKSVQNYNDALLIIPDIFEEIMKSLSAAPEYLYQLIHALVNHAQEIINEAQGKLNGAGVNSIKKYIEQDLRYGLYIIDNVLQDNDFQLLGSNWSNFSEILKKFCSHERSVIRNSACFGLSLLVQKSPTSQVDFPTMKNWLSAFEQCFTMKKIPSEKKMEYQHCQDNCVSAIGKILRDYGGKFEPDLDYLYSGWLQYLPLKKDKQENIIQLQILSGFLQTRSAKLVKTTADLRQVIKIYANVIKKCISKIYREENRQLMNKIKSDVQYIMTWQIYIDNKDYLIGALTDQQGFYLQNLLTTDMYTYN